VKGEEDSSDEKRSGDCVVPPEMLAEVEGNEDTEDNKRDHFLDHLELNGTEGACTDAIGGHLKAVLKEGDHPTYDDHLPQCLVPESQMSVPGKRHEDVGDDEENHCPHISMVRVGNSKAG